jgi:hypothetical protein
MDRAMKPTILSLTLSLFVAGVAIAAVPAPTLPPFVNIQADAQGAWQHGLPHRDTANLIG